MNISNTHSITAWPSVFSTPYNNAAPSTTAADNTIIYATEISYWENGTYHRVASGGYQASKRKHKHQYKENGRQERKTMQSDKHAARRLHKGLSVGYQELELSSSLEELKTRW